MSRRTAASSRPPGSGWRSDDRDVVGLVAGAQQAGDLDPDGLGLAAGAGRLEQHEAVVDRDALAPRARTAPRSRWRRVALDV